MYSGFSRRKRVTDPLDEKVKAQIIGCDKHELGYFSSGSEHSAHADHDDVASSSFSDLVFCYPENNGQDESPENDSDSETDVAMYESTDTIEDKPKPIFQSDLDLYRNVLVSCIAKALEVFSCAKSNKSILQRNVMAYLRNFGYNAAVCKTKWESCAGLAAGNYEFIDVFKLDSANRIITRYIVDLDFAAEFVIARPTNQYEKLLQSLPKVFVSKIEELKQILRVMSDAARRSLKSRGLHISPWRKHRFMQNKWLGSYKRTTNIMHSSANSPAWLSPSKDKNLVKCRTVGFPAAAVNGGLLFPATTRTR